MTLDERILATLTLYAQMRCARSDSDFEPIVRRLQSEWAIVGTLVRTSFLSARRSSALIFTMTSASRARWCEHCAVYYSIWRNVHRQQRRAGRDSNFERHLRTRYLMRHLVLYAVQFGRHCCIYGACVCVVLCYGNPFAQVFTRTRSHQFPRAHITEGLNLLNPWAPV